MKVNIDVTPVRNYPAPAYPDKAAVAHDPALLRALPRRWYAKPTVVAALMLTLSTGLFACAEPHTDPGITPVSGVNASDSAGNAGNTSAVGPSLPVSINPPAEPVKIPVFEHGSGRGSYGCEVVAPPVFLSEDEAAQVIREEAAKLGVRFDDGMTLTGEFPATNIYGDEAMKDATREGSLALDGYNKALGIGFEFVSQKDVNEWHVMGNMASSVSSYDMKGTAQRLSDSTENVVYFYDPGIDYNEFDFVKDEDDYKKFYEEQEKRILDDLRAQVRDFLAWLAAEGII